MPELMSFKCYVAVKYSDCLPKFFHHFHLAAEYVNGTVDYLKFNEVDKCWENEIGYLEEIKWED